MPKIRISTKQNAFTFSISPENRDKVQNINLTQTNIINTDSMIFTTNYIYKNMDIVSSFIIGLAVQRQLSRVIIKDIEIANVVLLIIQKIKQINEINFLGNDEVPYEIYERLLFTPYIKKISCYSMKEFMIEQLDKKNIDIIIRKEMLFISNFMSDNQLNNYSSIYYKRTIDIKHPFDEKDFEDFEIFCKINKYLKSINIYEYSKEIIRVVINILAKNKRKNIKIFIIQNNNNLATITSSIDYLKLVQEKVDIPYNYKLRIIYSNEYKKSNIISQMTINNIKVCSILVVVMVGFAILVIEYNRINAEKNINSINSLISSEIEVISSVYDSKSIADQDSTNDPYTLAYKEIFNKLTAKNNETVGYLKVNNTKVDYPIVKAIDNKYYLNHDFYKQRNTFGWLFMDYKNNDQNLDDNTIIYGHNTHKSLMFGTLINVLNEKWYSNQDNQIIVFNTKYYVMEWKIFSIYKIATTSDYLMNNFENEEDFSNFISLIKTRSIYDFNVDVTHNDKILTLSTCVDGNNSRAVIHAKLISKKTIY